MALTRAPEQAFATFFRRQHLFSSGCISLNSLYHRTSSDNILPVQLHHDFHTSGPRPSSPLFNLGSLSTSRENQYIAKDKGIPRTELAPHLQLIRSSEVDSQHAPGSNKTSTSTRKGLLSVKEESGIFVSEGYVTMTEAVYNSMKKDIKKLENELRSFEVASRHLFSSHQKRTREATILSGLCALLTLGIVYAKDIHEFKASLLTVWGAGGGEQSQRQEKATQIPETVQQVTADPMSTALGATSGSGRSPWTFSRLFWAA